MRFLYALAFWIVVAAIALAAAGWSGTYSPGADDPHWSVTRHLIGWVRNHAVDRRTAGLQVPALEDPAQVALGARTYAEHCAECHLAPGVKTTALHADLYPEPPALPDFSPTPAYAYWAIKHGFKMTAMPAWGRTLDDPTIWALVAFLQKQPNLGAAEYQALCCAATTPAASASAPAPAASAG